MRREMGVTETNNPLGDNGARLMEAVRRDPKRLGLMGVLAIVLIGIVARSFVGGDGVVKPAAASGAAAGVSVVGPQSSYVGPIELALESDAANAREKALRQWLNEPVPAPARNLFVIHPEYFPTDGTHVPVVNPGDGFWDQVEKS